MKKKLLLMISCSCIIILGFGIFKYFNHGKALKEVKPPDSKIVNTNDNVEKIPSFDNLKIEEGNPNEIVLK
ncbi:hypothetical protein [Hathewaya massiliensis]|uniref:hypothetical protein n=1 Tax=Hathewaya massiliensis TaxID=1964382 RepID=UPI0011592FDF|nr:hypothetical protein [Hathewaya massiliensis]